MNSFLKALWLVFIVIGFSRCASVQLNNSFNQHTQISLEIESYPTSFAQQQSLSTASNNINFELYLAEVEPVKHAGKDNFEEQENRSEIKNQSVRKHKNFVSKDSTIASLSEKAKYNKIPQKHDPYPWELVRFLLFCLLLILLFLGLIYLIFGPVGILVVVIIVIACLLALLLLLLIALLVLKWVAQFGI